MPSINKTNNIGLNQWAGNEYPKRQDFLDDNEIIDCEIGNLKKNFIAQDNKTYNFKLKNISGRPYISYEEVV